METSIETTSVLLSTGEFAQMCNVSRELLIHYDKIGLLKPKKVEENGYRYYSLKQLYLFDTIRFFMDAGMSMKEVKDYLENRSTSLFIDEAQNRIDEMHRQRDILDAQIGMMEKMRYITQRALMFPKGQPRLSYWDELWLLTTNLKRERTQHAYAEAMSRHSAFCREVIGSSVFPLGRIVDIPNRKHPDDFYYTKLITWVSEPSKSLQLDDRVERKPRGTYAVILHQGGTNTVEQSYEKLFKYLKKESLETIGPVYELDMNSYLMSDSAEDYLLHISILLKE